MPRDMDGRRNLVARKSVLSVLMHGTPYLIADSERREFRGGFEAAPARGRDFTRFRHPHCPMATVVSQPLWHLPTRRSGTVPLHSGGLGCAALQCVRGDAGKCENQLE